MTRHDLAEILGSILTVCAIAAMTVFILSL